MTRENLESDGLFIICTDSNEELYRLYANIGYPLFLANGTRQKVFGRIEDFCKKAGWNYHTLRSRISRLAEKLENRLVGEGGKEKKMSNRYPNEEMAVMNEWDTKYEDMFGEEILEITSKLSFDRPKVRVRKPRVSSITRNIRAEGEVSNSLPTKMAVKPKVRIKVRK